MSDIPPGKEAREAISALSSRPALRRPANAATWKNEKLLTFYRLKQSIAHKGLALIWSAPSVRRFGWVRAGGLGKMKKW